MINGEGALILFIYDKKTVEEDGFFFCLLNEKQGEGELIY